MSTDAPEELFSDDDGVLYAEEVTPQHGILGFTLRELFIVAVWLVMFVTSFFPIGWGPTLWAQGIAWILSLGLPTVAVFLIVLRRFSPDGIRRVGSLGIDQFASVAFAVALLWWVQVIWEFVAAAVMNGSYGVIWLPWVQLVTLLALVVLTVFAPIIPGIKEDFRGRLVTLAHRNANPVRPVIARPRPERPAPVAAPAEDAEGAAAGDSPLFDELIDDTTHDASGSVSADAHASGGELGTAAEIGDDYVPGYARTSGESDDASTVESSSVQPFWALAPTERDVVDERGAALFRVGPHAWVLVIEDRGGAFVVRHDDGRVGYLHDIADITRG